MNLTSIHEDTVSIPGLVQLATALIQPLAWEPPYTRGAGLKRQKQKQTKKKTLKKINLSLEVISSGKFC